MPAVDASRRNRYSRVCPSVLSHIRPRSFYSQPRAMAEPSIPTGNFLPDWYPDNACHRGLEQPAIRENNAFCSIIRRVVDGISAGISLHDFHRKPAARRRAELERRYVMSAASYGCTTITINREYYNVPTLARESRRQIVRNASVVFKNEISNVI
jgi:hypothetical protein